MECLLGSLVCAVDEEEFESGLLDSLVVPFAETELHGPLTQLMTCNMTPPAREALAGVELAHIFDTGWAIGKICGTKSSRGTWPVLYPGNGSTNSTLKCMEKTNFG